jgi:hypothetical protein
MPRRVTRIAYFGMTIVAVVIIGALLGSLAGVFG